MGVESSGPAAKDSYPGRTIADLRDPAYTSLIDFMRWLAAFEVMIAHARNPLLLGFGQLEAHQRTPLVSAWYFLTGFEGEAVLVFFVLSGYLVGGLSSARIATGSYDDANYLIDRVTRLYVVFLPALVLTALLDSSGIHWFASSGLYDGTHPMVIAKDRGLVFESQLDWQVFFSNLAMTQYFHGPMLGSNQPLWTLSCEFWFYMIFAAGAASFRGKAPWSIVFAVVTVAIAVWNGPEFVVLLGYWLIGMGVAFVRRPRRCYPALAVAALVAWLIAGRFLDGLMDQYFVVRHAVYYVLALLTGWVMIAFRGITPALFARLGGFNRHMADFSYSLYLIHFPVVVFAVAALAHFTGWVGFYRGFDPNDPIGIAAYAGIVVAVVAIAWIFARFTEAHTKAVRQAFRRKIGDLLAIMRRPNSKET